MMQLFVLALVAFCCSMSAVAQAGFDWKTANTSVWLSAGAYCETNTYLTRTYKGYSSGFQASYVIDDKDLDVQGYIGIMPSQSAIYVVFRGSTSIQDWVNNLDAVLTSYPRCSNCQVHKGFYNAEQSQIAYITSSVQALKAKYPSYSVIVTGHSLGAAMATLTAIDLKESNVASTLRMFNFGSPRVGNDEFAAWASSYLTDRNRITHYKDMVPHVPMHERFTHISNEWYEDEAHVVHTCTGYEDPNCSYQWNLTNIDDHMHYLTLYMGCDAVSN